jgi:hypothetical protein
MTDLNDHDIVTPADLGITERTGTWNPKTASFTPDLPPTTEPHCHHCGATTTILPQGILTGPALTAA